MSHLADVPPGRCAILCRRSRFKVSEVNARGATSPQREGDTTILVVFERNDPAAAARKQADDWYHGVWFPHMASTISKTSPGTLASYKVSVHSNRESANPLPHNYNHRGSYTPSD